MPKASRKSDTAGPHGAWHPSPAIQGSNNVFIDSLPALRKGDAVAPHTKPKRGPHKRSVSGGSPDVFVNGRPIARVGDAIGCGGKMVAGSGTVYVDELDRPKGVYSANPCVRKCMKKASSKGQGFVTKGD